MRLSPPTSRWRTLLLLLLAASLIAWCVVRVTTTSDEVRGSMAQLQTSSHYELLVDGKSVMVFGADTTLSSACWVDSWTLIPSCHGQLVVATDDSVRRVRYRDVSPSDFLKTTIDSLDSLHRLATWKIAEFEYWSRSHNVQDEGFEMVSRYNQRQLFLRDSLEKVLRQLRSIKEDANLSIAYSVRYKVLVPDTTGAITYKDCQVTVPTDTMGITRMQLLEHKKPTHVTSQPSFLARRYARMGALLIHRPVNFCQRPDSTGVYRGDKDSLFLPHGHGAYLSDDGGFFEGQWEKGKRNGFGFDIVYPRGIRTGEWRNDKFLGERMLYSSERIYGIDISKYQHLKGRKRYNIEWGKLRVVDLGNISNKNLREPADYPVDFIYIKSTEGITILNPYYKKDYAAARKHGFTVGTYHFFSIFTPADKQARYFLKHSLLSKGDLPPVLDIEPTEAQIQKIGGDDALFQQIRTWLRIVGSHCGRKPILYMNQQFVNRHLVNAPDLIHEYQIWIARYGEYKPDLRLSFWQLSPNGKVKGIQGQVDINVFNGYQRAYQKFLGENVIP